MRQQRRGGNLVNLGGRRWAPERESEETSRSGDCNLPDSYLDCKMQRNTMASSIIYSTSTSKLRKAHTLWCTPIMPVTQKAEAGEHNSKASLDNLARYCLKKKNFF